MSLVCPDESRQEREERPDALPERCLGEQGPQSSDAVELAQELECQASQPQELVADLAPRLALQPEELWQALRPPDLHQQLALPQPVHRVLPPERVFLGVLPECQRLRLQGKQVWRPPAQPNGRAPP